MSDNISQDIAISGEGNIVVGKGDVIINPLPPAEARLRRDLGILMKNVENTWIKGVLEKSVYEAALLELGMELREEAVDNPWRMVIEGREQPREILPRGKKIKDIFYEANGLLLILGEPGSGKTTTLLQLARDLIAEIDETFMQPVPVILNLSTWTNKQQSIDQWLVAELNSRYRLPKKDGRRWLQERRILPLLDGLDEVKAENRTVCVEKINQLVSEYGLQGLVVCSRMKDYSSLHVRLAFYRAIYLLPLTPEQIEQYLNQAGDKLTSLRSTLKTDEALRSMAQSPLILSIMSLAYQNASAEALIDPKLATNEARRRQLFDTYIARMFNRKTDEQAYSTEQTKQRLSWLAKNMAKHNQEVFLIEGLQPSWLSTRGWQWLYILASRLVAGICLGLIGALPTALDSNSLGAGLSFALTYGTIVGLAVGFVDLVRFEWLQKRKDMRKLPLFWWRVIHIVSTGLIIGLMFWLIAGPTEMRGYELLGMLFYGLMVGMIVGLIFGLRGSRQSLEEDIKTVEALRWSWRKATVGGVIGITLGLIFGAKSDVTTMNPDTGEEIHYPMWLYFGLSFALIGLILSGLHRGIVETKTVPNQGIKLSIKNALLSGLIIGLIAGLVPWLIAGFLAAMNVEPLGGGLSLMAGIMMVLGVICVPIAVLWYGGFDIILHYILRLLLIIQGHTPLNYVWFLDFAVDRIFLQKVGGGYRFIHLLLRDHFADLGKMEN